MQKPKLFHDNFQNYKRYGIPKAQLVIADIPYNIGDNAYGSNPMWYRGGTTLTAKVNMQSQHSLIQTATLRLQNICTFVVGY